MAAIAPRRFIQFGEARSMGAGDGPHQRRAGGVNGVGIDRGAPRRLFAFGGRHQHLGGEGGIIFRLAQHLADGGDIIGAAALRAGGRDIQHDLGRQRLAGFQRLNGSLSQPISTARSLRLCVVLKMAGAEKALAQ